MKADTKLADFEDNLDWEEKAKQNPLYAIMSHKEFADVKSEPTAEQLRVFYEKGVRLWKTHFQNTFDSLPATEDRKVLEYGCGMGRILHQPAFAGAHCYGIDISQTQLDLAKRYMPHQDKAEFLLLKDSRIIPLPDASVDYVYSFAVLQHIKKTSDLFFAIGEIIRVLKPGGVLKIHFPYRVSYFDPRYRMLKRWNFEESSALLYLHKKCFHLPVFRVVPHTHWGGAAYYVPLKPSLKAFSQGTRLTSVEHLDDGRTVFTAFKV